MEITHDKCNLQPNKCRKNWRKLLKKAQRKRRRQKAAKERDNLLEIEALTKLKDPSYQQYLRDLEEKALQEKLISEAEEKAWIQREFIAQQQFAIDQKRKIEQEAIKYNQQQKEFVERLNKKQEIEKHTKIATNEFEYLMQLIEKYLENPTMNIPAQLRTFVETRHNEPICSFYERTNCCRYGPPCQYNHRRPLISSIILIRNFFTHPLLEDTVHIEYDCSDTGLELTERDMRADYDSFFEDVVSEMESYGKILNFRTVRNVHVHLRGNVFVEYEQERSALNAFINLHGRYYAGKPLNVEFSNILTWRGAVCGLALKRKCPKGNQCNFLHLLRNPENKYNTLLEYNNSTPASVNKTICTPTSSWKDDAKINKEDKPCNWRWSESPEPFNKGNSSVDEKTFRRNSIKNGKKYVEEREHSPRRSVKQHKKDKKRPCITSPKRKKSSSRNEIKHRELNKTIKEQSSDNILIKKKSSHERKIHKNEVNSVRKEKIAKPG